MSRARIARITMGDAAPGSHPRGRGPTPAKAGRSRIDDLEVHGYELPEEHLRLVAGAIG